MTRRPASLEHTPEARHALNIDATFCPADAKAVDALGVAAFEQFAALYEDWPGFRAKISTMSALAQAGEIIVARRGSHIVGAVAYIGPHQPKNDFFPAEWAIMRMLVVSPDARGQGVGRALAEACIERAQRDAARVIGLHTSPIMAVALPMYLRMGFQLEREAPPIHGVPYGIYAMALAGRG